jgi:hypothetical protein
MADVKQEEGEELVGVAGDGADDKSKLVVEAKPADATKKKGRTLVVMGTYSIGKERIVKGTFPFQALLHTLIY